MSIQETELYTNALRTMEQCHMLHFGDRVAVGVSGGADSVALLALLCSLRDQLSLELVVCHVNHGLRGAESDADAAFVQQLAMRHGLQYRLCSLDAANEARQAGQGVEEYSRRRRYDFFAECAGERGRVATAHTLSDAVETVIFNLVRGTGVKGLCGIPRQRDNIIRPLRDCTREQVEAYLEAQGQGFRTDSTNLSDQYSRNYIRHNLVPAMLRLNPSLDQSVSRMMEQMEQQWQMTAELADAARARLAVGDSSYDREGFLALPPPVAGLLLQQWLDSVGAGRSGRLLELMQRCASSGSGAVELTSGVRFAADSSYLRLVQETATSEPFYRAVELPRAAGDSTLTPAGEGKTLKITLTYNKINENAEKFYNKDLKSLVDCDKIKEPVFVHEPRAGDMIRLQDRDHGLMQRYRTGSRGLSSGQISRMTVVEDLYGMVWAERLGADQKRRELKSTRALYLFEILEDEQ